VIYKATVTGCVSRQRLEMQRRVDNFAGLKRVFRTVSLGTSTVDGCGEPTIDWKRPKPVVSGLFAISDSGHTSTMLTLAITGFEADPCHVTDILGIEPTAVGRKGEPSRTGKPRPFNGWWHDVEPARLVSAGQHADAMARLTELIRGREPRFAQLREAIQPTQVEIYGGLYVPVDHQCGVFLVPDQMQLLAGCGIGWGLDLFTTAGGV
jgi:hypothetical protein